MPGFIDSQDSRRPSEVPRLSRRYRTNLTVTWWPPAPRRVFKSRPVPEAIQIIDLSMVGALFEGPTNDRVKVGMKVPVEFNDVRAVVVIRNIRPATRPGYSYYGMSFNDPTPELEAALTDVLADSMAVRSSGY